METRNLCAQKKILFEAINEKNLSVDERNSRVEIAIKAMMAKKLSLEITDEEGMTPLILASKKGHTAIVKALLAAKADPNKANENDDTPLIWAAINGHTTTVQALLAAKADPSKANKNDDKPLIFAATNGHTTTVEALLADDLNKANKKGNTPLSLAVRKGHIATVKVLLAAKADLDEKTNLPLTEAAQGGHTVIVKMLLAIKANPNKARNDGATPLTLASQKGHTTTAEALLMGKADPNKADEKDGGTPLMDAVFFGNTTTFELLLAAKADVDLLDHKGKSALYYSIEKNDMFIIYLLLKSKVKINNLIGFLNFLYTQNQSDPYVTECLMIIKQKELMHIEKLRSLQHAYRTFFSYSLQEISSLPKEVANLVLAYDGRFFEKPKTSPMLPHYLPRVDIFEPNTIDIHLNELKKDVLEEKRRTPGLFTADVIQEIDTALALGKKEASF